MNTSTFFRYAVLGAAITSTAALAAPRELSASASGPGEVERGGRSSDIGVARINLKPDGYFSLNLIGDTVTNFNGSWKELDRDTITLEITSAWGKTASAQGRVELQREHGGWGIETIKIAGSQSREIIKARFSGANREEETVPPPWDGPDRPGRPGRPGWPDRPNRPQPVVTVNSTRVGAGWYHMAGQRPYRLTNAHVQMYKSGRVFINVYGTANLGYVGTWVDAGRGTVRIDARGGLANERVTGVVSTTGRTFSSIALSGTSDKQFYKVEFDAR